MSKAARPLPHGRGSDELYRRVSASLLADRLAAVAGHQRGQRPDADRLANEPHRPVAEQRVRPAAVERVDVPVPSVL